ncbi:MAG: hypothetical protein ABR927_07435 [Bacteroidales bacterium]|jgi:hypothetical protein
MVTIVDFVKRQNREGKEFNALILQSGIELVKSKETGSYYATSKRASISSTFDDATCQNLIGQQIPGSIQKVVSEPYEFTNKETGEVLLLNHRWVYLKEGETIEEKVIADSKVAMPV